MKFETKRKKQLAHVKEWLAKARPELMDNSLSAWHPAFSLLIAVEQLVKYLEMEEDI